LEKNIKEGVMIRSPGRKEGQIIVVIRISGLFCFFLFLLLTVSSCYKKTSDTRGEFITDAEIEYISGDVKVDNTDVKAGDPVDNHSVVTTGADSVCDIVFNKRNIIEVLENTVLELDFSRIQTSAQLSQGTIINVLKKLEVLTDTQPFTINTPVAVVGVRGTAFYIKATPETTYVCVCNGTVTVKDSSERESEEIQAKHHIARLLTKTDQGIDMVPAEMLYHTDEDIERIAEKIGYSINWETIE
jgi:hypothetical protein